MRLPSSSRMHSHSPTGLFPSLGVTTQERNVQLSEEFFNKVVSNLRTQTDANLQLSEHIAEQQQRQVEAAQALTQETVDAYMDFASSVFGFWQRGTRVAEETSK